VVPDSGSDYEEDEDAEDDKEEDARLDEDEDEDEEPPPPKRKAVSSTGGHEGDPSGVGEERAQSQSGEGSEQSVGSDRVAAGVTAPNRIVEGEKHGSMAFHVDARNGGNSSRRRCIRVCACSGNGMKILENLTTGRLKENNGAGGGGGRAGGGGGGRRSELVLEA
jgi:hypothetical protein